MRLHLGINLGGSRVWVQTELEGKGLQDRVCCFLDSRYDIKDLKNHGNVQQTAKTCEA